MEIRTDTWHYRVWRFITKGEETKSVNLCGYVSTIIMAPFLIAIIAGGLVLSAVLLLWVLVEVFRREFWPWVTGPSVLGEAMHAAGTVGYWALVALLGVGLLYLAMFLVYSVYYGFKNSQTISLFRSYLKAKKDRICPLVTFVEPA